MSKGAEVEQFPRERPVHQRPRRLAEWLNPTGAKKVHSLIDKVYQPKNLEIAWERVEANQGAGGVDGQSTKAFGERLDEQLVRLHRELRTNTYQPRPVRQTPIPKQGKPGEYRTLGIPTVYDRVCQQSLLNRLEPIFEPMFDDANFGYRRGRSTHDALRKVWKEITSGREWIVDARLNVYTGSKRAANDAMVTLKRLFARLRLEVNNAKSAVARVWERKFLGYSFWVAKGRVSRPRVAPAALAEMKARVRVISSRTGGRSLTKAVEELWSYLTGWKLYFQLAETPGVIQTTDEWIRRRMRAVQLKQWKRGTTVYRELRTRGVPERVTRAAAAHASRWWAMAAHSALQTALPTSYFDRLGVPRLAGR